MEATDLATAIMSGTVGPAIGASIVIIGWLWGKYSSGVPLLEQLKHVVATAKPLLIPIFMLVGASLMAGMSLKVTLTVAITALLTAGGWATKNKPEAAKNKPEVPK